MLSEIRIDTLIEQKADLHIRKSDYSSLKQECLKAEPIVAVIDAINTQLSQIASRDKELISSRLSKKACTEQVEQDKAEEESDVTEATRDISEEMKLNTELSSIPGEVLLLEEEIRNVQQEINQLQTVLSKVNFQMKDISTTHEHYHSETPHAHHHHGTAVVQHQGETIHNHPNHTIIHQHDSESALSNLEKQKNQIAQELKKRNTIFEEQQSKFDSLSARAIEINKTLIIVLQEKALFREKRKIAREKRLQTSSTNTDIKALLSTNNYLTLTRNISIAHNELNQKKEELINKARLTSYNVFLLCLKTLIPQLMLGHQQTLSLELIVKFMRDYLDVKKNLSTEEKKLQDFLVQKETFSNNLQENKQKLQRLKISNPQLEIANEEFGRRNQQLALVIPQRHNLRNNLLKGGVGTALLTTLGIGGTFLAINLLHIMTVSLLFFLPAALVGLVTMGLFLATLILTGQNGWDENQISENSSTIRSNSKTITAQKNEIITLETEVIPSLYVNVEETERGISLIADNIKGLVMQAEQLLNKAKKLIPLPKDKMSQFFTPPTLESTAEHRATEENASEFTIVKPEDGCTSGYSVPF